MWANNKTAAAAVGCSPGTAGECRSRFLAARLDGSVDQRRPGCPAPIIAGQVEDVAVSTVETTPSDTTRWSRSKMAVRSGLSASMVGRIWKAFGLESHREDGFKVSPGSLLVEKTRDIVALCLGPPESAAVLCVDEKSQALAWPELAFPMMPGMLLNPTCNVHATDPRHAGVARDERFTVREGSRASVRPRCGW